jgi:putative hydrolase of the HAD superfamily
MSPEFVDAVFEPRPKLVLFDLDNTLCDYNLAREIRTRYAFEPHFSDTTRLEAAVRSALDAAQDGDEHLAGVLTAFGVADPALCEDARLRYIEDRYRGLRLFDESLAVIAAVSAVSSVGMVTNGPTSIQRPKIDLLQIAAHFPVIVVSEEVGFWKPDPRIFRIALEQSGCAPDDAIYVGDSAEHDIPGAHAAGMRAVWVNRDGIAWPGGDRPDAEIRDLYDLLPLLRIPTQRQSE